MSGASIRDAERTRSWSYLLVICYNLLQSATATLCEATILLLASVKTHTGWMSAWLKVPSSIHTLSIQSGRKWPQGNQAPQSVQMSAQCVFPIAASTLMGDDTVGPDREREIRLDGDASTKYLGAESLSRQKPFLTITATRSWLTAPAQTPCNLHLFAVFLPGQVWVYTESLKKWAFKNMWRSNDHA